MFLDTFLYWVLFFFFFFFFSFALALILLRLVGLSTHAWFNPGFRAQVRRRVTRYPIVPFCGQSPPGPAKRHSQSTSTSPHRPGPIDKPVNLCPLSADFTLGVDLECTLFGFLGELVIWFSMFLFFVSRGKRERGQIFPGRQATDSGIFVLLGKRKDALA